MISASSPAISAGHGAAASSTRGGDVGQAGAPRGDRAERLGGQGPSAPHWIAGNARERPRRCAGRPDDLEHSSARAAAAPPASPSAATTGASARGDVGLVPLGGRAVSLAPSADRRPRPSSGTCVRRLETTRSSPTWRGERARPDRTRARSRREPGSDQPERAWTKGSPPSSLVRQVGIRICSQLPSLLALPRFASSRPRPGRAMEVNTRARALDERRFALSLSTFPRRRVPGAGDRSLAKPTAARAAGKRAVRGRAAGRARAAAQRARARRVDQLRARGDGPVRRPLSSTAINYANGAPHAATRESRARARRRARRGCAREPARDALSSGRRLRLAIAARARARALVVVLLLLLPAGALHRRARAVSPARGPRARSSSRARTPRPEDREHGRARGRRARAHVCDAVRRRARALDARLDVSFDDYLRRDERPAQGDRRAAVAALRGGGRHLPRAVRGVVRRARGGVRKRARRSARVQGRRAACRGRTRERLLLPRSASTRPRSRRTSRRTPSSCSPRRGASRCSRCSTTPRRSRSSRSTCTTFDWGVKLPGDGRRASRHVRVDRARSRTTSPASTASRSATRPRRPRAREPARCGRASTHARQGHRAVPRHLLAGVPHERGRAAAGGRLLPRLRARPQGRQDVQDARQRRRPERDARQVPERRVPVLLLEGRARRAPTSGVLRGARSSPRTSAGALSPTRSATCSTAAPRSSAPSATAACAARDAAAAAPLAQPRPRQAAPRPRRRRWRSTASARARTP